MSIPSIKPKRSYISIRNNTVTLNYTVNYAYSHIILMVYFNGVRIDKNGQSGKVYDVTSILNFNVTIYDIENFQILIANSISDNPTCPNGNMFNNYVIKDLISSQEYYIIPTRSLQDSKNRNNFISPEQKEFGLSIRRGCQVILNERKRFIHKKIRIKPATGPRNILAIQDYRYSGQLDIPRYKPSNLESELIDTPKKIILDVDFSLKNQTTQKTYKTSSGIEWRYRSTTTVKHTRNKLIGIPAQASVSLVTLPETKASIYDISLFSNPV